MRTPNVSSARRSFWIFLMILGLCVTLLSLPTYAQRTQGEIMVQLSGLTADVRFTRYSPHVFGTMCSWYPQDAAYLGDYLRQNVSSQIFFQFVDRDEHCPWPGSYEYTFGYGVYRILVNSYPWPDLYVDFRDADYGTLTGYDGYKDMKLYYTYPNRYFNVDKADGPRKSFGTTYHIWDMQPKQGAVKVPITITDNLNGAFGGTVIVDGASHRYPYKALFYNDEDFTVEAVATQPPDWMFDSWSDGGARSHTVTPDLNKFGYVLTATYRHSSRLYDASLNASAYPNPFNPTTKISYSLPGRQHVKLSIIDNLGRQIQILEDLQREPGMHEVIFDGTYLPSGVYFYRVQTGGKSLTRPLLLVK